MTGALLLVLVCASALLTLWVAYLWEKREARRGQKPKRRRPWERRF